MTLMLLVRWVTSVAHVADGRIVSGGMDSKLWLWPTSGNHGTELQGHSAPISQVCTYLAHAV